MIKNKEKSKTNYFEYVESPSYGAATLYPAEMNVCFGIVNS